MKYDSIKENYERGKNWSKDKEWVMNIYIGQLKCCLGSCNLTIVRGQVIFLIL